MSNTYSDIDRNDFIHQHKKYTLSNQMSPKNNVSLSENRVTRSQSNRPFNTEATISLDLQGKFLQATSDYQVPDHQNIGTARHYKISNQTKFQIYGQELGPHSYEVEKVIDQRVSNEGIHQYLVKWKGQKLNLCQWLSDIDPTLIERYENQIRSGKTQPGKGAYAFKRALRRDTKINAPAGFVTSNSNVVNSQKLRITTNGPHPQVLSAFRNFNVIDRDQCLEGEQEVDYCYNYCNYSLMKKNKKYFSRSNVDNFYDDFDQPEFYGGNNNDDNGYISENEDLFKNESLNKRNSFVPLNRAKAMANIIRSRPSPFQQSEESSRFLPAPLSAPSRPLADQNSMMRQSNDQIFKPKPIKRENTIQAIPLPRLLPIGQNLCVQRSSNTFKPFYQKEGMLKKSRSVDPSSFHHSQKYCYFPYSPLMQSKATEPEFNPFSCKDSSCFEISPSLQRKARDDEICSQNNREYINGGREPNFCEGSFARGDKPKQIEKIWINEQNQKVVRVSWQSKKAENGKQFQPNPTQYLWEIFPEAGFKLVLDYLLDKLVFEGMNDRTSQRNNDQVSTKAQSD